MQLTFSPRRLVIADDYPDVAESLAELIAMASPFPVELEIFPNGALAFESVSANPPHCAILDIDMPVMNGIDAALAIRKRLGRRAPLIVAITGDASHWDNPSVRAVFDHFLIKPAAIDALIALLGDEPGPTLQAR